MYRKFKKTAGRIGVFLLIALFLALLCAPSALAAEEDTAAVTAAVTTANEATDAAPATAETIAGAIADFLRKESAGILSGTTLLFTLLISLGFRKRVIPPLLEALSSLIAKSREAVGAINAGHEAEQAELSALLTRVEGMLDEAHAATTAAGEAAAALLSDGRLRTELQAILSEQSDLLYELLMSANLPQYQKDRIGEQHARVRAALAVTPHD